MKILGIVDGKFAWVDSDEDPESEDDFCHQCEQRTKWTNKGDWTFCGKCGSADYIGPLDPSDD